jgi:hypothetical protein
MSAVKVSILVDNEHIGLSIIEVREMATTIADAYPNPGRYVTSFGFLNYTVIRKKDSCVVEVTNGAGFHNMFGEPPIHLG